MTSKNSRRVFFKALLGSTTAAVVLNSKLSSAQAEKSKKTTPVKKQSGYHETQHIRDYYNKINF